MFHINKRALRASFCITKKTEPVIHNVYNTHTVHRIFEPSSFMYMRILEYRDVHNRHPNDIAQ